MENVGTSSSTRFGRPKGEFDVVERSLGDARTVTDVDHVEVRPRDLAEVLDALDERPAIAALQVSAAERAVGEHEVAGEADAGRSGVKAEVIGLVAGRVEGLVVVVADLDPLAVLDPVVDVLALGIESPRLDAEGVADGGDVLDVIGVRVREVDPVEVVDVRFDPGDDVEVRARVHERGRLAGDEKDVRGEGPDVACEVVDHDERLVGPRLASFRSAFGQLVESGSWPNVSTPLGAGQDAFVWSNRPPDMYRKGHYGVSLLVFAPIAFVLLAFGRADLALVTGGTMLWLAMLPDVDHRIPGVPHRGPTHSLLFATLVGAGFGAAGFALQTVAAGVVDVGAVAGGVSLAAAGFGLGALTVVAHLLGDALTPAGVNFLWPLSGRTYTLGVWTADNVVANYGLLAAGVFATGAAAYLGVAI